MIHFKRQNKFVLNSTTQCKVISRNILYDYMHFIALSHLPMHLVFGKNFNTKKQAIQYSILYYWERKELIVKFYCNNILVTY